MDRFVRKHLDTFAIDTHLKKLLLQAKSKEWLEHEMDTALDTFYEQLDRLSSSTIEKHHDTTIQTLFASLSDKLYDIQAKI